MTDRELLELAAKAAGINRRYYESWGECGLINDDPDGGFWNPLVDDAQALRLAAKLHMHLEWQATGPFPTDCVEAYQRNDTGTYFCASEPESDYRRAIVTVAAEIGRQPCQN